jgi:hypothetical protein
MKKEIKVALAHHIFEFAAAQRRHTIAFLDMMASDPWDVPEDLINSSPKVKATAEAICALERYYSFKFATLKVPGSPIQRGLSYPPVLALISKISFMNASLVTTGVRRAAHNGDLRELRWYARRQQRRQDDDIHGPHLRMFHAPDQEGMMPIHGACHPKCGTFDLPPKMW